MLGPPLPEEALTVPEVIGRFCRLASRVATVLTDNDLTSDCFCGGFPATGLVYYRFNVRIIEFIEQAVTLALEQAKTKPDDA